MRRGLSYTDALAMLGVPSDALREVVGPEGTVTVPEFLAVCERLIAESTPFLTGVARRLAGVDRLQRTEMLQAFNVIAAGTGFFEAVREALEAWPDDGRTLYWAACLKELHQTRISPLDVLGGTDDADGLFGALAGALLAGDPNRFASLHDVTRAYWGVLRERSATHYQAHLRMLAKELPEFGVWVSLRESPGQGPGEDELRRLEELLGAAPERPAPGLVTALARAYRKSLDRPVLGLEIDQIEPPTVAESFITPRFRLLPRVQNREFRGEASWGDSPVREDLDAFMAAFLVSAAAFGPGRRTSFCSPTWRPPRAAPASCWPCHGAAGNRRSPSSAAP
jgi:hypothetical protein